MKYNIISLDDARLSYKNNIRRKLSRFEEVHIPAVDGRVVNIKEELDARGLRLEIENLTLGEVGIWLSVFDNWQWCANNEDLIVLEDDAVPNEGFANLWEKYQLDLPDDYGLLALWVPENQYLDYIYDVVYDEYGQPTHVGPNRNAFTSIHNYGGVRLARVYQGYGNVALQYSPQGAQELIDTARHLGLYTPIDCFIFDAAHAGRTKGYAPKPHWARAVTYDWAAETTVHNSEKVVI